MDHLITYKEAAGFLKNPPMLEPCLGCAKVRALHKHVVMALKQLVCPQSAIHGWSGLVMDPVMHALIKPIMPFVPFADPGNFPVYNNFTTEAASKMTDQQTIQARQKLLPLFHQHQQSVWRVR
jgi:hypothetical protein